MTVFAYLAMVAGLVVWMLYATAWGVLRWWMR
jgi:hypothetical protein